MSLPQGLPLGMMANQWAAQLDPVIANPVSTLNILSGINIKVGINVINHKLGRKAQGWIITDINGAANIYRSAPLNSLTLTLTSDAAVTIDLGVF